MHTKATYTLVSVLAVFSSQPTTVVGVSIGRNEIQARQAPTAGQPVTGIATFFEPNGVDACGQVLSATDIAVALPTAIFSSSLCGKQIAITNTQNQQTVTAPVADQCAGCSGNNLDLTSAAFQQIADLAQGTAPISWTLQS